MGELLTWFGNFVNFSILVYFYAKFIQNPANVSDMWIAIFGLITGILIQIYNIFEKW
ncbi:hypothetical protein J4221_01980 [Candidatus Pacearchaeota archaeon]|nr:hypothetical protein [Candidatus Pacearchaeota archaeon]